MWKKIRIGLLLFILLIVAMGVWRDYNPNWDKPIIVLLHPINADGQKTTEAYIQQLSSEDLSQAQDYIHKTSAEYRTQPVAVYLKLGRELTKAPPPVTESNSILAAILWSLKFRLYAWQQYERADGVPSVRLFVNFYDPKLSQTLKKSTALQNGQIGSINLFASHRQAQQNQIVLLHELFHAFGARDKYDLLTGLARYPEGYANPYQQPLHPQIRAELMAGRIPISAKKSIMPDFLNQTIVSRQTADELGWTKK